MKRPRMILFDYGQTLVDEEPFDGVRGMQAVLDTCMDNPNHATAEEVQRLVDELNGELGRFGLGDKPESTTEVHNHSFQNYLYEYFGLVSKVSPLKLEVVFHDAASPGRPTPHIEELLGHLKDAAIRSAVISNISFSGQALANRVNGLIPRNDFEFIMASSEYVFRKPHRRIFELAVRKAGLKPGEVWYCGDNGVWDVDGAQAAGLVPVWYKGAYGGSEFTPAYDCMIIYDWRELIAILEA